MGIRKVTMVAIFRPASGLDGHYGDAPAEYLAKTAGLGMHHLSLMSGSADEFCPQENANGVQIINVMTRLARIADGGPG